MACEDQSRRKCFTFIWKLENARFCWQKGSECIESPPFTVDELYETNWILRLYLGFLDLKFLELYLRRQDDNKYVASVEIDCAIDVLSSDGTFLLPFVWKNAGVEKDRGVRYIVASRNEVFLARRSEFLPRDTLTVRCRMWKSVGEMSKDVQCFARTRIAVERRSFLWGIENFSTLKSQEKRTYEIKSSDNAKTYMSLELFLTGGMASDETICFKITPNYQNMKVSTFQLSIVDDCKDVKCFQDEFLCYDPIGSKDFTVFLTKKDLLEKKSTYLPKDVLSLRCECVFSLGTLQHEIEKMEFDDSTVVAEDLSDNWRIHTENEFSASKCILLDNFKSMFNNCCVSDVKLRTKSQTYPSHKVILSARSPVFKAMFSNDMKEKIKECVDIEDLNDDTVLCLLRYIYSAEVEELEWDSAIQLYEAADKYEVLDLKGICSSYLKNNLCPSNACEALEFADLHHDEDFKVFVQDFILRNGKDVISSEEWEKLMETNLKLAAETMRRKYKE